ncbi:hypothetical protein [Pedococcus sp. 5OH_020]|uniref:hypothetical protein n=1 Tax=Pedococcus sp. 5OH_020 TaxID=2989814 RepID=UPI0022E9E140|nr:hypothetical protein [Pedococcus sp. 5OH_020]
MSEPATRAIARGLTVIGTASPRDHDHLDRLGAIRIAHGPGLVERVSAVAPGGVNGAFDISGAGVIADLVSLVGHPPPR